MLECRSRFVFPPWLVHAPVYFPISPFSIPLYDVAPSTFFLKPRNPTYLLHYVYGYADSQGTRDLAEKVQPFSRWLAIILEISVLPLETKTADVARDIVKFLASNPSEDEVVRLELSSAAKERSKRLLILSDAEALNPEETRELDELEKLEQNVPGFAPPAMRQVGVPCSAKYINWLGFISIPVLALTAFVLIGLLLVRSRARPSTNRLETRA